MIRLALAAALVLCLGGCAHREPLGRVRSALGTKEGWATVGAAAGASEAVLRFDICAWDLIWPAPPATEKKP